MYILYYTGILRALAPLFFRFCFTVLITNSFRNRNNYKKKEDQGLVSSMELIPVLSVYTFRTGLSGLNALLGFSLLGMDDAFLFNDCW